MRLLIVLALFFAGSPTAMVGQVAALSPDTVESTGATIFLQHTFFGGAKFVQNQVVSPAGGSYGRLRDVLSDVPEAHALASQGSKIVTHGRLVSVVGALIGTSTFFVHGEAWEIGLSTGGFLVAGVGGAIQTKGKNRIDEAVWRYNEAVRSPGSDD